IWDYFDIQSGTPYQTILSTHTMPGARWFPGATINYTEHIFRNRDLDRTAIIHASEMRKTAEITWGELFRDTAALQQTLKRLGVKKAIASSLMSPIFMKPLQLF